MQNTYQPALNTVQDTQENTTNSESQSQQKQPSVIAGPKRTDKTRKGEYWETYVQLKAWEKGAEVFLNAGSTGPIDLIILWDGKILTCDVKSMDYGRDRFRHQRPHTVADGVQLISVNPETKQISFPPNRTPAGWETFWL